jgi:hypothetical protein
VDRAKEEEDIPLVNEGSGYSPCSQREELLWWCWEKDICVGKIWVRLENKFPRKLFLKSGL